MSNLDAYKQIGEDAGNDALAMVADIMERNQASTASLIESLYEGEREAHEKTKRRLAVAEARLAQGMDRLTALFDYDPTYS